MKTILVLMFFTGISYAQAPTGSGQVSPPSSGFTYDGTTSTALGNVNVGIPVPGQNSTQSVGQKLSERVSVFDYAVSPYSIGDGAAHPLSLAFGSCASAHATYSFIPATGCDLAGQLAWAAAQKGINSLAGTGKELYFQRGEYLTAGLSVPDKIAIIGEGNPATWEATAGSQVGSVIHFLSGGFVQANIYGISYERIGVIVDTTAGPAFTLSGGWVIDRVSVNNMNPSAQIVFGPNGSIGNTIKNFYLSMPAGSTVPAIYLLDSAGGSLNNTKIGPGTILGSLANCPGLRCTSAPMIQLEGTAGETLNSITGITFEEAIAGSILMLSIQQSTISDSWMGDLGATATTAPVIRVGKSAQSGAASSRAIIVQNIWTQLGSASQPTFKCDCDVTGQGDMVLIGGLVPYVDDNSGSHVRYFGAYGSSSFVHGQPLSLETVAANPGGWIQTDGTVKIAPASDSTAAFRVAKAAGTAGPLNVDTTNGRVGIGVAATSPMYTLDVEAPSSIGSRIARRHSSTTARLDLLELKVSSTGTIVDGYGVQVPFVIQGAATGVEHQIAVMSAVRAGADDVGQFLFSAGADGGVDSLAITQYGPQIIGAAPPTCTAAVRGTVNYNPGGTGVADAWAKCTKAANDTYSWVAF